MQIRTPVLPVPRYVSLKYSRVNARKGPSLSYPVSWQYQRQGLPLVVVAEMDIWRKVRDINGDESWIRTPQLTGQRRAIAIGETDLYKKPTITAGTRAIIPAGTILELVDCSSEGWCEVQASGRKGWVERDMIWGDDAL